MDAAYYRGIIDSALDAIITIDAGGRVLSFNRAAERLFGHSAQAATGRDLAELIIPPRLREAHRAGLRRLNEIGISRILDRRVELSAMRVDGTEFPVELTVVKVPGTEPPIYAGYVRDISERIRAEKAYRELIDAAPVGIYRARSDGRLLYVNPAFMRMTGAASTDQLVGRNVVDLYVDPADRAVLIARLDEGDTALLRALWKRLDGSELRVELDARRVAAADGSSDYLVFVRDVTERYALEQQLHQSQRMDAVGRLAGGIAHDFNNILTAIMGQAELMREAGLAEAQREGLDEIRQAARRAAGLTEQLLAFGRRQILEPRILDLRTVVQRLAALLGRMRGDAIEFDLREAPDLGAVEADPNRIEQALIHLIFNARDAMANGGRLTVALENVVLQEVEQRGAFVVPPGSYVVITVSDTGEGMDPQAMALIFEPFFVPGQSGGAAGLGLAALYGLIRQSGGHLVAESAPGDGTTFRIYLPRVDAPAAALPVVKTRAAVPGEYTILVVEDEPGVRTLLERTLSRAGYRVLPAENGLAAREIAAREPVIDLLLTDVIMPGGGGRQLADDLVAARPALKVIYMSGYTDDVLDRARVREADVVFLQKPFSSADVLQRIRELLAR